MDISGNVLKTCLLAFLAFGAFYDVKNRKIPVLYDAAGFTAGIILKLTEGNANIIQAVGGILVGASVIAVSFLSRQAIGAGDGLMFTVTGVFLGLNGNILLLIITFSSAALYSVIMLVIKKIKYKSTVPMIPFMLAGYIAILGFI